MKSTKTFLEISKQEYLTIYPQVLTNAIHLFEGGKILAEAGFYGQAISHLILAIEEYIKALYLFLEGKEFQLRHVKSIKGIFYSHAARHSIIRDSYSVWM